LEARAARVRQHRLAVLEKVRERRLEADCVHNDERVRYAVQVLSELPTAIVVWNEDGELMHVNRAAMELLDHDDESISNGNHVNKLLSLPRDLTENFSRMVFEDVTGVRGFKGSGGTVGLRVHTTVLPTETGATLFVGTLRPHISPAVTPAASVSEVNCGTILETGRCEANSADGMRTACSSMPSPMSRKSVVKPFRAPLSKTALSPTPGSEIPTIGTPTGSDLSDAGSSDFRSPHRMRVHFSRVADEVCAMLDSVRQPTMLITEEGKIVHWTPACQEVFGPTAEEMYGQSCQVLIPEPSHQWHTEYFSQMSRERNSVKRSRENTFGISRHALTRQVRDVLARTVRSATNAETWRPRLIPVRMVISAVNLQGNYLWMCTLNLVSESSKSSMCHLSLMQQSVADSKEHPAVLEERPEKPKFDMGPPTGSPGFTRLCWQGGSNTDNFKLKDFLIP